MRYGGGKKPYCRPRLLLMECALRQDKSQCDVAIVQHSPAATRIPPELFAAIGGWVTATTFKDKETLRKLAMLSMTCRYWNGLYRPSLWQYVLLSSREAIFRFASLAESPPTGYCSIGLFVQTLDVRAVGIPSQPWIHLVPAVLKQQQLLPHVVSFTLDICMKQGGLGSPQSEYVTMHLTHDSLPKSLSAFHYRCNRLHLRGINFRRAASFLRFIRYFRQAEALWCNGIHWDDYPKQLQLLKPSRDPPLRRITFPVYPRIATFDAPALPQPGWVSVLWSSVRRRHDGKHEYLLQDDEARLAMRITSGFQGFHRRKHVPSLELNVLERLATNGRSTELVGTCCVVRNCLHPHTSTGFDFFCKIDENVYEFVFSMTASDIVTAPNPGAAGFSYRALHITHIIVSPRSRGHRAEVLEKMLDYEALAPLLLELPHLEKVVLAFEYDYKDESRTSLLDRWSALRSADKLIVARAGTSISDTACRWIEEDPVTLQPTGEGANL